MSPTARLASAMSNMELRNLAWRPSRARSSGSDSEPLHGIGQGAGVARRHEQGAHPVLEDLGDAADGARHDGQPDAGGFHQRDGESLVE